jgi:hypothetical protein
MYSKVWRNINDCRKAIILNRHHNKLKYMYRIIIMLFLVSISLTVSSQTTRKAKRYKKSKKTETSKNNLAILPKDYQVLLGKGMDVDWAKTRKGMQFFNTQAVRDFKSIGLSHVRIRIQDDVSDKLLIHLDKIIDACLAENLIPIIAYQGAAFKGKPTEQNLDKIAQWWITVAYYFKNKSYKVSFDLLIEVTEALNKEPEMLNKLYEKTVIEIRKTNPNRIIFISPIVRSAPEYLKVLRIPSKHNNYLMAEWHFYASGPDKTNAVKKWTTGTEEEKELIRAKIRAAKQWSDKTGILTWVGAWMPGNYNKGDQYSIAEQVVFANFVTCALTKNKIPFAFNSDAKFYNRETSAWIIEMKPVLDKILETNCE